MAWVEHDYADAEALHAAVAAGLAAACTEAIASRGRVLLALAGGRTPLPAYRQLAAQAMDWSNAMVLPTDERCVPHTHPACNLEEIRAALAAARGIAFESLTTCDGEPAQSEVHARAMLARHAQPFDAVVLGMGSDAHTASLFPGAANLAAALDPASTIDARRLDPVPLPAEAPFPRITLTLPRLLRARSIHLVVTGQAKRAMLRQAQSAHDPLRLPVAAVLHAPGAVVNIHWSP